MTDDLETVFPLPLWFVIVAAALFGCSGCASKEEITQMVCHEQMLGQSDQGLLVVRHFCMKEE